MSSNRDWHWKPKDGPVQWTKVGKSKKRIKGKKHKRLEKIAFYKSWEWKKLRYECLKHYGARCMLCNSWENIVVDHIKPRSRFPELALDPENVQVLCDSCNRGKSCDDYTDFRPKLPMPELSSDEQDHMRSMLN